MENIEEIVKNVISKKGLKARKSDKGWIYEVEARGNPYEDFRDEYEDADIIDDRVARRTLPNQEQDEKYLVVLSSKELGKAKLSEIHNERFAELSGERLIVKCKEDVVTDLMNKHGIKPHLPGRPPGKVPEIFPSPQPHPPVNVKYGFPSIKYGFPGMPFEPVYKYGMPEPYIKYGIVFPEPFPPKIKYGFPESLIPKYRITGEKRKK